MAELELSVTSALIAKYTGVNSLGAAVFNLDERLPLEFESGTGSGKVNLLHASQRTLAASASENLDLINASLLDAINVAAVFAVIKVIHVRASANNANDVLIGGAGSNAFIGPFVSTTTTQRIKPGGVFLMVHPGVGWTADATHKLLKFANGGAGTSVTYDLELAGGAV